MFADIKPEHPYSLSITKAPKDLLTLERPEYVAQLIEYDKGRKYIRVKGVRWFTIYVASHKKS